MRDVGRTREKVQNHEPGQVVLNFFSCSHNIPSVDIKVQKHGNECHIALNRAFATLQKLFIKTIKFQTLPETLKTARSSNRRAPQKCWLASKDKCGSQHENIDAVRERNYALPRMMPPRSEGKVSQSNYIVKSKECLSVEADVTLLISVSCKHAADEINISFPAARGFGRLAEANTNFRQVCRHPFD